MLHQRHFRVFSPFAVVLCPAVALLISLLLQPWTPHLAPMLFLLSVAGCAWIGGLGPSLLATILSVLALNYFFLPPLYTFRMTLEELVELSIFSLVAILTSRLVAERRRMMTELQARQQDLEQQVAQRTAALAAANEQLQEELREREQVEHNLRQANAELEQLAYVIGHDLKEPLRAIRGYAELLEKRCHAQLDEKGREFLAFLVEGARRMELLIRDLLAYTRMAASAPERGVPVPLNEVITQVLQTLRFQLEDAEARVDAGRLPAVWGHPRQFLQLFQNLLSNAIKYRRPEEPLRIQIRAQLGDGLCTVEVADNGIGIAAGNQERVFHLFTRLHGAEIPGTGLGLAICRKLVERQGGRMWVESELGKGTTVLFTLPVAEEKNSLAGS